eukprot:1391044-Pyramimonas_sp.AAC.1
MLPGCLYVSLEGRLASLPVTLSGGCRLRAPRWHAYNGALSYLPSVWAIPAADLSASLHVFSAPPYPKSK